MMAEIFGYAILVIAAGLLGWETYIYKRGDAEVHWLQTPHRFRRRMVMAVLLVCVGLLIVVEARGFLTLSNIRHLVIYVSSLTALALLLFILSVRDLGDMARNAEKQAIEDLKSALEEQKRMAERTSEPSE